jgi:CHAT domain-containing protein
MHGTLTWLWDAITGPVLERLGLTDSREDGRSPQRIWWVPCGPLAHFPLHAAGHHLDEARRKGRTVLDQVESSYTPTVRALAHARSREPARGKRRPPRTLVVAMPQTPHASDLPGAKTEFERLTRMLPATKGLVGKKATRDAVLSRLPSNAWAHFACHAASDPTDPSNSHLLVQDHDKNPLRVREISRLNLAEPELAYLSACGTAVTTTDLANESIHIATAFQLAGYPHVIGTLWEINDTVAAEIAERIYAHLASTGYDVGVTGTCVHQVVRLVRDRYPRIPTLWAAHIHVGA